MPRLVSAAAPGNYSAEWRMEAMILALLERLLILSFLFRTHPTTLSRSILSTFAILDIIYPKSQVSIQILCALQSFFVDRL